MTIQRITVPIRELVRGFDDGFAGAYGYGGKLNIRPAYQREFVYEGQQRVDVIDTVLKKFPLNVMYWALTEEGKYECVDGQQRTISICQFKNNEFSYDGKYFFNLSEEYQNKFLSYGITVFICEGTDTEKLEWFRVINNTGSRLNEQEMHNAVYTGYWLNDARYKFSRRGCPVEDMWSKLIRGSAIRQDYFETFLKWIADRDGITLIDYMARHQKDDNADELFEYSKQVYYWMIEHFDLARLSLMKGLPWGIYYNKYKDTVKSKEENEREIDKIISNPDVTKQNMVYLYILSGEYKHLNIRAFSDQDKRRKYKEQGGCCAYCGKEFKYEEMEGDHIMPWVNGGLTVYDNLQLLCRSCNAKKGSG